MVRSSSRFISWQSIALVGAVATLLCINLGVQITGAPGDRREISSKKDLSILPHGDDTISPPLSFIRNSTTTSSSDFSLLESLASLPLCSRAQVKDGRWIQLKLERPPYISKTSHLRCYPLEYYQTTPWLSWDWSTFDESCELSGWNGNKLCRLLRFATVSIIGDSLSWEMYSSLLQLLGQRVLQSSQHRSKIEKANHGQLACGGKTKFIWRNDAHLENITDSIMNDFPTVLILNRGAHFKNDTILMPGIRQSLQEVRDWLALCAERGLKCHFFWRTTVPGHPGCGNFTEPVNDIEFLESRVADLQLYNNRSIYYRWYDYQHQNKLVLQELRDSGLEYQVIDAYELNMRRPDEHRAHQGDCLHSCYPGKMDVYNRLLLHYLNMVRSDEDVKRLEVRFQSYLARASNEASNE
jgi:hypothetical protein